MTFKVLNVGGGSKGIPIPTWYDGWEHHLLDIDPKGNPDVVCDARELKSLPEDTYDAIYCSHNLEHFYRHDVPKVLSGFLHVLKPTGFAEIRVPDLGEVIKAVIDRNLDVTDKLYDSEAGPITVLDVIYGYGPEIEKSGQDWYAHKSGYSFTSIQKILHAQGFKFVFASQSSLNLAVIGFCQMPSQEQIDLIGLPPMPSNM